MQDIEVKRRGRPRTSEQPGGEVRSVEFRHKGAKAYRIRVFYVESDLSIEVKSVDVFVGQNPYPIEKLIANVGLKRLRSRIERALFAKCGKESRVKAFVFSVPSPPYLES